MNPFFFLFLIFCCSHCNSLYYLVRCLTDRKSPVLEPCLVSVFPCVLFALVPCGWSPQNHDLLACLSLILPALNCFCPFFISPKSRFSVSCTSGLVTLRGGNVVFSFYLKYLMPPRRPKHGSGYELLRSNFSIGKLTIPQYDYFYGGNRRGGLQQYVLSLQMEAYHRQ